MTLYWSNFWIKNFKTLYLDLVGRDTDQLQIKSNLDNFPVCIYCLFIYWQSIQDFDPHIYAEIRYGWGANKIINCTKYQKVSNPPSISKSKFYSENDFWLFFFILFKKKSFGSNCKVSFNFSKIVQTIKKPWNGNFMSWKIIVLQAICDIFKITYFSEF